MQALNVLHRFVLSHCCFRRFQHVRFRITWVNRVDVDPITGVFQRGGLRQVGDGAFGGAVGGDVWLTDEAVDRGEVDNPAAVAGRVGLLGEHLGGRVFDTEPNAACVDCDGLVEDFDRSFVDAPVQVARGGFWGNA